MVLIVVPVALFFFGAIVYEENMLEVPGWVEPILSNYGLMALSLFAGVVVGLIALLRSRERSVLVWIPLLLAPALPIAFLAQLLRYSIRHASIVPELLGLVAVLAVISALHFPQRGREGYGLGGALSSLAAFGGVGLIVVGAFVGDVFQEWLLATNLMGVGLWAMLIGLAGLMILTLRTGVLRDTKEERR